MRRCIMSCNIVVFTSFLNQLGMFFFLIHKTLKLKEGVQ